MRKLLLSVILVAGVAVSCQREPLVVAPPDNQSIEVVTSEYAIGEEEALARLDSFMAQFEGATRSTSRRVRSISHVSYEDVHVGTRSSEELDVENLLYIVEFEDGQGSAIIGADERVEPVYAVLDETVLTIEDFNNAANGTNTDDIRTFTAGMIAETASLDFSSIPIGPPTPITPPDVPTFDVVMYETDSIMTRIMPLLNTKWGQDSIYNDACPRINGQECLAGCGPIAAAQILNYNATPSQPRINGRTHSWDDISQFRHNNIAAISDSTLIMKIAQFIADIGEEMDAEYGLARTSTSDAETARFFRRFGYRGVSLTSIDEDEIVQMLDNSKPVFIRATDTIEGGGHAWVLDGRIHLQITTHKVTYRNGALISRELYSSYINRYMHCNYGWDGDCDGYYFYNIFDLRVPREGMLIDTLCGDNTFVRPRAYVQDVKIITYNL